MTSKELRESFLNFFKEKGHAIIPSASLIPEHDPTVLFTTAGMHPLVPFLLGEKHPGGKRLANVQACIRTGDIEEVGDEIHHTFFEMLGNWSLGDYFKKEAIEMSWEFLTSPKWLGLEKEKIAISIFEGDEDAPEDKESKKVWLSLGVPKERIKGLPKKDNWWGPAGQTGPCGPNTEMFYWAGKEKPPKEFNPEDKKWVEVWNDVFMEYYKKEDGKYEPLSQKNIDTGMGLERMLSVINGLDDDYKTDVFWPIIKKIEELSGREYEDNKKEFRIIADHIKAATFILGDEKGIVPAKEDQGYVLRKLIRRAVDFGRNIVIYKQFTHEIGEIVIELMGNEYPELKKNRDFIIEQFIREEEGYNIVITSTPTQITTSTITFSTPTGPQTTTPPQMAEDLFKLRTERGITLENAMGEFEKRGVKVTDEAIKIYQQKIKEHQELSRTGARQKFKGGLADAGEQAIKYHTATHLLLAALRQVLGNHVFQKGSNITAERLRFDFSHSQKMIEEEIKKVEDLVNQKIKEDLPVTCEEMILEEAKKGGAMGVFENKYGEKVKVYTIGDFSKEICGGPHVDRTGKLGQFKIQKEESSSAGIRRIRAKLQ